MERLFSRIATAKTKRPLCGRFVLVRSHRRQACVPSIPCHSALPLGSVNANLQTISMDNPSRPYTRRLLLGRECLASLTLPPVKARWGRDGGLGGKGATERRPAGPCLLGDKGALRASTAEQPAPALAEGALPPKQATNSVNRPLYIFRLKRCAVQTIRSGASRKKHDLFPLVSAGRRYVAVSCFAFFQRQTRYPPFRDRLRRRMSPAACLHFYGG